MATRDAQTGAIQHNPLAVGPKRYGNNASFTATSGKLGSEGYDQRERNNARRKAVQARLQRMKGAS